MRDEVGGYTMANVETCPSCWGSGTISCPICDGKGSILKKRGIRGEFGLGERVECQSCQGTGKLLCQLCGAAGQLRTDS